VNPEFVAEDQLARDLQDWVAQKVGGYKRPRWIEFLPEIPKTATGKLQRFKLRELHEAQERNSSHPETSELSSER
jgi:acyl-coenzyme A synthetase/AMP-(fatty) acid ligase